MVETPTHSAGHAPAPIASLQTCDRSLGAYGTATTNGLYSSGVQYGLAWEAGHWTTLLTPHLGLSHTDHPVQALPLRTQFDLGLGLALLYEEVSLGLRYAHWSNAGLKAPNEGLDTVAVFIGGRF